MASLIVGALVALVLLLLARRLLRSTGLRRVKADPSRGGAHL